MSVAALAVRAIMRIAPADRRDWACAMACEVVAAEGPGARRFAAGCVGAAIVLRGRWMGRRVMAGVDRPRAATVACGVAATVAGLVYLLVTGAPAAMPVANTVALIAGLMLFAAARGRTEAAGAFVLAAGVALLAVAFVGASVDGAARWVRFAGLAVQPSLVLLPAAIVLHVAARSIATTVGMTIAAAAMAVQPDRAMAGVMLLALIAGGRRSGSVAPVAAAGAFVVAMIRPDALPAVPWVDGILYSAVREHVVAGAAVLGGTVLLLLPLAFAARDRRAETLAFGACWLGVVAAAALGNYPTPLVGFGGSAILGYLLAAAWLPARAASRTAGAAAGDAVRDETSLFRLAW